LCLALHRGDIIVSGERGNRRGSSRGCDEEETSIDLHSER
jgi:hypothetical protein